MACIRRDWAIDLTAVALLILRPAQINGAIERFRRCDGHSCILVLVDRQHHVGCSFSQDRVRTDAKALAAGFSRPQNTRRSHLSLSLLIEEFFRGSKSIRLDSFGFGIASSACLQPSPGQPGLSRPGSHGGFLAFFSLAFHHLCLPDVSEGEPC